MLLDPAETGAVTMSLHQDVQAEACEFPSELFEERIWHVTRRPPGDAELAAALEVLRGARRPLVIAGGGVHYSAAGPSWRDSPTRCGIPVAETSAGKGAMRTAASWRSGASA